MASMGMLGAMSGAAGGMAQVMMQDIETARQERLNALKATTDRETNRLDAADRHGYSTKENQQRHDFAVEEQDAQNKFSLTELAARGEQEVATKRATAGIDQANEDQWTPEYDKDGKRIGQVNNRGEWKAAGETSTSSIKEPDKLVIAETLQGMGVTDEKLVNFIMGEDSPEKVRSKLIMELGSDPMLSAEDVKLKVDAVMKLLSGGAATADPAAVGGDAPPVPGAQKAPDGNWYVKQGDKFFRVDPK